MAGISFWKFVSCPPCDYRIVVGFLVMGEGLPPGPGTRSTVPRTCVFSVGTLPPAVLACYLVAGSEAGAACTVDLCESLMICEP